MFLQLLTVHFYTQNIRQIHVFELLYKDSNYFFFSSKKPEEIWFAVLLKFL